MTCSMCGDPIPEPSNDHIVAAGGWCMPSETLYQMPEPDPMCGDCKARMLMIAEIGIDPGRKGSNLKVSRGGIKFPRPTE